MSHPETAAVRSSLRLNLLNTLVSGVFQFVLMMVLARLLTPADYGTYALSLSLALLSAGFVNNVMERYLIVSPSADAAFDQTPSIALLAAVAGALVVAICAAVNGLRPGTVDLGMLLLMAVSVCTASWAITPRVALRRELRFGPIVAAELAGLVAGPAVIAIILAAVGWGAQALALGACVQGAVVALMLRWRVSLAPLRAPTLGRIAHLVRSASAAGGNSAAEVLNGQIAPLVIGTGLGAAALGLFNRAHGLVQMPIQLMVASINRVMISALHSVSDEREALRAAAQTAVCMAAIIATPLAAGIAGASRNLVLVALGEGWSAAMLIMPLLALAGWTRMMGSMFGVIAEARHAFSAKTKAQIRSSIALAMFLIFGAQGGLAGAVWGLAAGCCAFALLYGRLAARELGLPLATLLSWLIPGIVTGLPCLAVSLALDRFLAWPPALALTVQVLSCGMAASVTLTAFYPALALRMVRAALPAPFWPRMLQ